MAFVVARACVGVKDTACIAVCPCDVIHPTASEVVFAEVDQLFIDPVGCIDCGLCAAECPVNAIFHEADLPAEWRDFIEKNAAWYRRSGS